MPASGLASRPRRRIATWAVMVLALATPLAPAADPALAQDQPPAADAMVPQMAPGALARRLAARVQTPLLLYDVRETEEYSVSHIRGARRVSPGISAEALLADAGPDVKGAVVVFYCSLGIRSADLAQAAYHSLMERGAAEVHVLAGGIIDWHNALLPLVDGYGPTRFVHPFHDDFKAYLHAPHLARMQAVARGAALREAPPVALSVARPPGSSPHLSRRSSSSGRSYCRT